MALSDLLLGAVGTGLDFWNKQNTAKNVSQAGSAGYNQGRTDIKNWITPYQQYGQFGVQGVESMPQFSYTGQDMYADPSYKWRLDQGLEALSRTAAGKGAFNSGSALAGITDYAQNAASQEYQAGFNRAQQTYNTNLGRYEDAAKTGAVTALGGAQSLATLAARRGELQAGAAAGAGEATGGLIKDITGLLSPTSMGGQGGLDQILNAMGISGGGAGLATQAGGLTAAGLLGGGAAAMPGAAGGVTSLANLGLPMSEFSGIQLPAGMTGGAGAGTAATAGVAGGATSGFGSQIMGSLAPGLSNVLPGGIGALINYMQTGDMKSAAVTGGLTYLGASLGSIAGPVGTVIGGLLGGLAGSALGVGDPAKPDSSLHMGGQTKDSLSGKGLVAYSDGPWGANYMTGRHFSGGGSWQGVMDHISAIDTTVSAALTPEENQQVKQYLSDNSKKGIYTYRDKSGEGGLSGQKVYASALQQRMKILYNVLGPDRYNQLDLTGLYTGALSGGMA